MKRVYTSHDQFQVKLIQSQLQSMGIECYLKNEYLSGAIGELPPLEAWLELWLVNESDIEKAMSVINQLSEESNKEIVDIICRHCEETNPSTFELCWSCGKEIELSDSIEAQ